MSVQNDPWAGVDAGTLFEDHPDVAADVRKPDVEYQQISAANSRGLIWIPFVDLVAMTDPDNSLREPLRRANLERAADALDRAGYEWVDGRLQK